MKHLPRSPMNAKAPAVLALAAMLFATLAHAEPVAKMAGGVLVNASSMTLYTFDKDVTDSGKSVCNDACASLWPPSIAPDAAQPEGDQKAGDMTGDNFKKVWHVIK